MFLPFPLTMRFFVRKRKQTPAVIIVALIDVLIVLVIFLMVTTTFRNQQPAVKIVLPESSQSQKTGADESPPLVVSVDAKGTLRLGPDAISVTEERLKSELVARAEKDPQLKLAINADKDAPFGQIIKVTDAAREAHIKMVNAFTRETAKP
jgi:biopolymer transport protein ExbD